ncbi:hypothetical protein A3Q56_08040, partial [Intoshia linei]
MSDTEDNIDMTIRTKKVQNKEKIIGWTTVDKKKEQLNDIKSDEGSSKIISVQIILEDLPDIPEIQEIDSKLNVNSTADATISSFATQINFEKIENEISEMSSMFELNLSIDLSIFTKHIPSREFINENSTDPYF